MQKIYRTYNNISSKTGHRLLFVLDGKEIGMRQNPHNDMTDCWWGEQPYENIPVEEYQYELGDVDITSIPEIQWRYNTADEKYDQLPVPKLIVELYNQQYS